MTAAANARRMPRTSFRTRALIVATRLLQHVPTGLSQRVAWLLGGILYRAQPARRRLVRANLERVATWLVANKMANAETTAAAGNPKEMDRLVRRAFGHYARGYLESSILPVYGSKSRLEHVQADDWAVAAQCFPPGKSGPLIIIGLHFGAVEIPGLWATKTLGARITAPMETIGDPGLQAYFEKARAGTGLNVIASAGAATELRTALANKEMVALVADRPVGGGGTTVELFGAPARLPAGPAVLADESGAPAWLIVTRRVGWSDYRTRIEQILPATATDSRRDRLTSFLDAQARAFERAIADAPEQWWTIFFPIWQDIR